MIRRRWTEPLALGLLCAFFLAVTALWMHLNVAPPGWDDSWYLTDSLKIYDGLWSHGVRGWLRAFFVAQEGGKAPLMCALPTAVYLVAGRNPRLAMGVQLVFMIVLLYSVYQLGKRYWGQAAGVIAAFVTATLPALAALSRIYYVEYGLTALTCLALWLLVSNDDLMNTRRVVAFSIVCGFGLLQKILFPLFIFLPVCWMAIRWWRRRLATNTVKNDLPRPTITFLAAVIPMIAIALPWYAVNLKTALSRAAFSGFSHEADVHGTGGAFTLEAVLRYLKVVVDLGTGPYYALLMAVIIAVAVCLPRRKEFFGLFGGERGVLLFLWGVPFALFLFGRNKEIRLIAPILPVFALALAAMVQFTVGRARVGGPVLACAALALPLVGFMTGSFGFAYAKSSLARHLAVTSQWTGDFTPYDPKPWPHSELLRFISSRYASSGAKSTLIVDSNTSYMNSNNMDLAVTQLGLPILITTTAYGTDLSSILPTLRSANFYLYKDGGVDDLAGYGELKDQVLHEVKTGGHYVEVPCPFTPPEGSTIHLFRNISGISAPGATSLFIPGGVRPPEPCSVKFSDKVLLCGLSAQRDAQGVTVAYQWRCMKTPRRIFKCFTHVVNDAGEVVGWLDHDIINGEPPMTLWVPDDSAIESLHVAIPGAEKQHLHLLIGLYNVQSNERWPIAGMSTRAAFSSVENGTALSVDLDVPATQAAAVASSHAQSKE